MVDLITLTAHFVDTEELVHANQIRLDLSFLVRLDTQRGWRFKKQQGGGNLKFAREHKSYNYVYQAPLW